MPLSKYLKVTIGNKQIQVSDPKDLPISIDYSLEDPDNFQSKPSGQALGVKIPATLMNDIAANTFRNPDIADFTDGNIFRGNQPFIVDENGFEILSGKAFLHSAVHNQSPKEYNYDLLADNADWKVDLEEATLYDFLKDINFTFSKEIIIASWAFDGANPSLPYVFAPVRYRSPMGGTVLKDGEIIPDDGNMLPIYMRPAISKYFILFWAFKSLGYKIQSAFLDSNYFRRQVMPWTWGNFLDSDGTKLSTHQFRAKSTQGFYYNSPDGRHDFFWDLAVSNDSTDGMFDNNNDYHYDAANKEMVWDYNAPDYGNLEATFSMQLNINARLNGSTSEINTTVFWYKNGVKQLESAITRLGGTVVGGSQDMNIKEIFFTTPVSPGDKISAKVWVSMYAAKLGFASIDAEVMQFQLDYFRIPLGGEINFQNYTGLKKYKIMDYFRGLIDEYNLSIKTDTVNKIVVIEPTHAWSDDNDPVSTTPGYFVNDFIDWNGKEDLSKDWEMQNYNDYNQELNFTYKPDSNDGILKIVQDRNINTVAAGKYVFPDRFKTGKKTIENRFFAATMHYEVDQWKGLGTGSNAGISPQMVCMIPENVSNTSNSESANTFEPKSCFYKGLITGVGAWKFDGEVMQQFPFMFSVNYKAGGEDDPILSYSDENINGVIGKGLLKRFYWQRLAIMRNGQWYNTWFRLKNVDVAGQMHREYKSYKGQRWELVQMTGYKPLQEISTACLLRKWAPVSIDDFNNTFPSSENVLNNSGTNSFDVKYAKLKCLTTDIPV